MAGADRLAFALTYQISPIILTGGAAGNIPGGMLPILSLTQALGFPTGLLSGGEFGASLDDYMMHFQPLPGGTLIEQKIGMYPFANQAVAANAVIKDPLTISMLMFIKTSANMGYQTKTAAMLALQATLEQHNASGGTYTIATPDFFYTDCVMLALRDVSRRDVNQPQNAYQWDFIKPLVSMADAQAAQNNLMSKISAQTPTSGTLTGIGPTVGPPTAPGPTLSLSPAASGPAGAGVANPFGGGGAGAFGLGGPTGQ